jgi:dihydropteroate synthase
MSQILRCGKFSLDLSRPLVMGVVNVTPDSFSDGGEFLAPHAAIARARQLIQEGADIIDIGGESSRPGAASVSAAEESSRIVPVLRALRDTPVPLSIDTVKPEVMRTAIAEGAGMVNDITALAAPEALQTVATGDCAVCLMHMQGEPRTMQQSPCYADVVREVKDFLSARVAAAERAGISRSRIVIDPGFGFGKNVEHNLELLRHLAELTDMGIPVLAGWSRKSSLGRITGRSAEDRLPASLAAALIAVKNGAQIVRVHDVAATRDALAVWQAVEGQN